MIKFEEMKNKFEKDYCYYSSLELLYDAYNALVMFEDTEVTPGQDIFAICLEGPPGAGKTSFAEVYVKLANSIFHNVELIDYQCDKATGKNEFVEDINVCASVMGEGDKVNIPGKFIKAINKVNEGKRVVLFIDEYDKAREETDSLFLKFLQSGKIDTIQHGDLAIKDEYKNNLQVIFCKNDFRKELTGPLTRRLRITTLQSMKPSTVAIVANRLLIEESKNPVDEELLNLALLMYGAAYSEEKLFSRLPALSEILIALSDANRIMKLANAPKDTIYNTIFKNMFKTEDDKQTFDSILGKNKNFKLKELIDSIKQTCYETDKDIDIKELIAEKILSDEKAKIYEKRKELQKLIDELKDTLNSNKESEFIQLQNGSLVTTDKPIANHLFQDESARIKRGYDIWKISNNDWTEIATIIKANLSISYFVSKLKENIDTLDIVLYENGILLSQNDEYKLIAIYEITSNNEIQFKIFCNFPVLLDSQLKDISAFINFMEECFQNQQSIIGNDDSVIETSQNKLLVDALVYSDNFLSNERVMDNVYHISIDNKDEVNKIVSCISPQMNKSKVLSARQQSLNLLNSKVGKNNE